MSFTKFSTPKLAKQMDALRARREQLRALQSTFATIASEIEKDVEKDVALLPERLWWTEIEDDMHVVSYVFDVVDQSLDDALTSIAQVTGEDEPELAPFMPPLPTRLPTQEEVFAARRARRDGEKRR